MPRHSLLILVINTTLIGLTTRAVAQNGKDKSPPQAGVIPFDAATAQRLQDAWAKYLSARKTLKNSIGMQLILIPPGKFRMLDADVTVAGPYYLGRTEVTRAQWTSVMGTTPWKPENAADNRPAILISWNDARAFCAKLTAKEKNGTYRLPTEAEWEFACRAGTKTRFSFGDDAALLVQYAWCGTNAKRVGEKYAHDVGLKKPNAFGLFDMHGNVWEFCAGEYTTDFTKEQRPRPAKNGLMRVAAGGSWLADLALNNKDGSAFHCRSNARMWPIPTHGYDDIGFRVVWSPPSASSKQ